MVPELRPPTCPRMPVSVAPWLAHPVSGAWHVAQLMVPSAESRPSKYNCAPSRILASVCGLSAGMGTGGADVLARN